MNAVIYIRFSTPEQAAGDSERRQQTSAKKYARENNLIVTSTYIDKGVSAFEGKNATSGQLGVLLEDVDNKVIPPGSTLICESLDRLSRNSLDEADKLVGLILAKNISIATWCDNKLYTPESKDSLVDRITRMVTNARAREESEMKSLRGKNVWSMKHKLAAENKIPKTAMCPSWLELDENRQFSIKQDVAKIYREIIDMYLSGYGYMHIVRHLNKNYETVEFFGRKPKQWYETNIKKFLSDPAMTGTFTYVKNRKKIKDDSLIEHITDYYPAIASQEEYARIQSIRNSRNKGQGGRSGKILNIFANLVKCTYCKGTMRRDNRSSSKNGKYKSYVVYVCQAAKSGKTNCNGSGWKATELETSILKSINEINIDSILSIDNQNNILSKLSNEITLLEYELSEVVKQKNNVMIFIRQGGNFEELKSDFQSLKETEETVKKNLKNAKSKLIDEQGIYKKSEMACELIKQLSQNLEQEGVRKRINLELKKIIDKIYLDVSNKDFQIEYKNSNKKYSLKHGALLEIIPGTDDGIKIYFKNNVGIVRHDKDGAMLGIEMDDGNFGMLAYDKNGKPIGLNCNGVFVPYDMNFIQD